MNIAVCVAKGENLNSLTTGINDYKNSHNNEIICSYYNTAFDFLDSFLPGQNSALIFDELLDIKDLAKIRQMDKQIRFIYVMSENQTDIAQTDDIWNVLPSPPANIFIISMLKHLQEETKTEDSRSLILKTKVSVTRIEYNNIEYMEVLGRNIIFHLADGGDETIAGTFSQYANRLIELPNFIQTSRSYVVNMHYVQKLSKDGILTNSGAFVPISRSIYTEFKNHYLASLMLLTETEPRKKPIEISTKKDKHILLVDDDPAELTRWGNVLQANNCQVSTAQNGETALNILSDEHFDCVILDVQLGNSSGFDLHQSVKNLTDAPILFLSTLSDFEHQAQGFHSGAVDYITKDINNELFWLKVESRIKASLAPLAKVSSGQVMLQISERTACIKGTPLPLTTVEFNLLHLFVNSPQEIFSPTELYQKIWGNHINDNGQTIQMHLFALSNKLDQASPNHHYIEAVWGKGYRFVPDYKDGDL